jgi:DNA topoisomerase-1
MAKKAAVKVEKKATGATRRRDLLIVESPTKAHSISKMLGGKMHVLSSKGHIADLPKSQLGVDIENGFEPRYIRIRGKASVINELKKAAKVARTIYIGCDPDREGEAIAYSVANEVSGGAPIKRVMFFEITPKGLAEAFKAPGDIDMNKVDSHRARRVIDRLVGYLVSPILWKAVRGGLSAGRVQTVALRMIVEREREIQNFKPEEYWVVRALFAKADGATFEAQLSKIAGRDFKLRSAAEVEGVKAGCASAQFSVAGVKTRDRVRRPLPPYVTATMVQDAAQRLGFASRRTTRAAQQLFEGLTVGSETVGLITYPRTDSFRVAEEAIGQARQAIEQQYGKEYVAAKARHYPDRKGAQGAHEAIRPTRLDLTPARVRESLAPDQWRLYDLIYRRFLASQMAESVYEITEAQVAGGEYTFSADALRCKFCGFEKAYGDPDKEKLLPGLEQGEAVDLKELRPEQKFTQPPARYTEATLIKRLDTNGIGRPSTYSATVSVLFDREYIERKEGKLHPTELGTVVHDVVVPRFSNVFEIPFTSGMERELDAVEEGGEQWRDVVGRFYKPFKEDLDKIDPRDIRQDLAQELDEECPTCGAKLAERWGRYGKFTACSRYPECKYIKKDKGRELAEKCPQCGKPLVERTGRFGPFVACSGYPDCKYIKREPKAEPKPVEGKCPTCGKGLVERAGRFGPFVACSGYPKCRYIVKGKRERVAPKPVGENCPECGKPLVERQGKRGPFVGCSGYPKCRYIRKEKQAGEEE